MRIRQRVARILLPYGRKMRVMRGPAKGMRFIVQPGMGFSYALGAEAAAPRSFARWITQGATVYDVGSNKGQMALIFAALVGRSGCVLAFEPAPAEYASLVLNLRLNDLRQVRAFQAAAFDAACELQFAYPSESPTQGKLVSVETTYSHKNAQVFPVSAVPLDAMLKEGPPPSVIKIDVEGSAAAVLRGARRIIEEAAPAVYVELHGPEEQAGIRDELLAHGYVAQTLSGDYVADPASRWHSPLWCYKPESAKLNGK